MPEKTVKKKKYWITYTLTPLLLLLLTGGILVLSYVLAPTHRLQKYLNLVFMDNLKIKSVNAGLRIREQDINTENRETGYETGKIVYPKFGEQCAMLIAPSINLNVGVYYGVSSELLTRGACQSTQSAVIGEGGNTVIDAHVNTYFSDLSKLKPGDEIQLYTTYGSFTYRVTENITFDQADKRYVAVTEEEILTLYTCQPQVLGSSDIRVGVRCVPVKKQFDLPAEE
ncbi:MAG: class D sortase [Oscillospiraceae bacterium]|nr:class D sortase [Oscillospiraceae bacterium]